MEIQAFYPDSGIGGCCGPQFVVYDQNSGINPPLVGNGGNPSAGLATNVEFDVRFDPSSVAITNSTSTNWPTIEVGTRGNDPAFGQHDFGTFTIAATETNWVHEVIPIAPNSIWTNIPDIYFKYYSTAINGFVTLFIDNIKFTTAAVPIVPPVMTIQKATPGLRVFAGSAGQYDRAQLVSVDTNQSWVDGTYPVTYSFTVSEYADNPPVNEIHVFLTPLNFDAGQAVNQFTDYSSASNNIRLQIVGGASGSSTVAYNLAWKTNLINSNPTNVLFTATNSTPVGTWAITFSNATDGSVTAPGSAPVPFSLPPDVSMQFTNPLVAFFGVQPNSTAAIGQYVTFTKIQTTGVAGVPINADFTGGVLDTNILGLYAAAMPSSLVPVSPADAWWVAWTYPDYGAMPVTKPDLTSTVPWKTPLYYTGYNTNSIFQSKMGSQTWVLLPPNAAPTVDGTSNGVPSPNAFFRVQNVAPVQ
jgi:hypothetical protein